MLVRFFHFFKSLIAREFSNSLEVTIKLELNIDHCFSINQNFVCRQIDLYRLISIGG